MLLHYVQVLDEDRPDPERIDLDTMRSAIRLTEWFKAEARRVYGVLGESEAEDAERKLIEFLQRRGGTATARDVQRGCRWLKEPGEAEEALEGLVKRGLGRWDPFATSPRGGQPVRRFALLNVDRVSTEPPSVSTEPPETSVLRGSVDCRRVDNSSVQLSSATLGGGWEPPVGTRAAPPRQPKEPPEDDQPNAEPLFLFI